MKRITEEYWLNYIKVNTGANKTAARQMERYLATYGTEDMDKLTAFAYGLVTKYGEASAALSCEVYESIAKAQGVSIPDAEPAETASFEEVAKAVRGAAKRSPQMIPDTVGRLVKQAGADTTLKNALRDGAYFAWVPHGDTCPFCCMLAGNGWQRASKKTVKGDHAEHIHANCDCEFAVSFHGPGKVEGYDPEKYRAMYDNAEGGTWQEKLNSLRRQQYAANPEKYRKQSREAYARRKELTKNNDVSRRILDSRFEEIRIKAQEAEKEHKQLQVQLAEARRDKRIAALNDSKWAEDKLAEATDRESKLQAKVANLEDKIEKLIQSVKIKNKTERKLFLSNIERLPVKRLDVPLTEKEIIRKISGGDMTSGSCASIALAYAGQKKGWDVLDFRGGVSEDFFANKLNKVEMFNGLGVTSIVSDAAKSSLANGKRILTQLQEGKEYYLFVGKHAAIVRNNNGVLQYLELQSSRDNENGWNDFDDVADKLKHRFGCTSSSKDFSAAYAVDISQLDSDDFGAILAYINTDVSKQKKGAKGSVK